ncbi:SDR family NAD(P)-dependent oxidoreductase [Microbaculum marinisediminis]|uniref:SDR family oxidoreductase n=1 Tax=Microbaculum marinisediminis TaxID=2931392 RepID=A0AAW5R557_9HYPH|nr:SDR family oxidoreductase [Microbaculum sp. A6E488]MCT8973759.1 SDR family oxidoreductase [Microbaculum sp. A6E488]
MSESHSAVALVTGAAGDIGRACSAALAGAGHRVASADLAFGTAEAREGAAGGVAGRYAMDVAGETSVESVFAAVEADLGPVSILVCCAGIMAEGKDAAPTIADLSVETWDRIHSVNARGTFLCVREMLRRRARVSVADGRIVTFSSAAAQLGGYRGDACYVSSKAAILGFTKIAARQAADLGITVNCVAAGPVETGMFHRAMSPDAVPGLVEKIPLGRVGRPDDVADAVLYLTSKSAGWVTGATLDVNGGYRMQ